MNTQNPHPGMKSTKLKLSLLAAVLAVATLTSLNRVTAQDYPFVFVSTPGNNSVMAIDPTWTASPFASGLSSPYGLAFTTPDFRNGYLYVANLGNNTIVQYNSQGASSLFATNGLNRPYDLAYDAASQTLYAANYGDNTIYKFDSSGTATLFANTLLNRPVGLTLDGSGNLYVANLGNNTIAKFTPGGTGSVFANTGLSSPVDLAFDSSGNLYAANYFANSVEKYSSTGTDLGSFLNSGNSSLARPWGLMFDSSGNLFVANYNSGNIQEYDSSGTLVGTLISGLSRPTFLVPTIVPEPTTWALLGAGAAVLLLWRRRR